MNELFFEWDSVKNASNEAKTVFSDDFARLIADPEHSEEEERFILLGESIQSNLLIVCHCIRDKDSVRIISARKADKKERHTYERFRYA